MTFFILFYIFWTTRGHIKYCKAMTCLLQSILTIHVWVCEVSPPAGASAGVDNSSQELAAAQLDRLHLCSPLVHTHQDTQNQRQNHQGAHAGYLSAALVSSKPTAAVLLLCSSAGCNDHWRCSFFPVIYTNPYWSSLPFSISATFSPSQWHTNTLAHVVFYFRSSLLSTFSAYLNRVTTSRLL